MVVGRLTRNWPYKLLALGTAAILAVYVHSEKNPWTTASVTARVEHMHLQEGYVATLSQEGVAVSLEGPKSSVDAAVARARSGEVTARVDLARLQAGPHNVPIRSIQFPASLPGDVTAQPATSTIAVSIEARTSRTLPVEVKIKTPPPIGLAVGEPTVTPDKAVLSGASSLVGAVTHLVVIVDPTPLRPSVDEYAPIRALDEQGDEVKGLVVDPAAAHVMLKLAEAPANKAVFVSPSFTGQPRFPYRVEKVTVMPSSVTIRGRPELLAGTSTVSTDEVDVTDAMNDVVGYVAVHVPPGLTIQGSDRVKVTVRITLAPRP